MTHVGEKYKCRVCGNEVVVTHAGAGVLVCCGQPMSLIAEGLKCDK
ncbi:MAG: desulfoferrodoxin FeS4 iron-binding domain-containing protein [Nitrospirae bacterium]|nr:desulfoferrodoxin FeS4 iron-binding domain-containing protein [Nitrospirota bacterium]